MQCTEIKVAQSRKVFHLGSNRQKKMPNHSPEHYHRGVNRFSNPGASSNMVGIICSPGWNRVNSTPKFPEAPR